MGTGSDTTLAQVAAEVLDCSPDRIVVFEADTDISPYDSGSYASSTAYVTGKAVEKAARQLRELILQKASEMLSQDVDDLYFDGEKVLGDGKTSLSLEQIAYATQVSNNLTLEVTQTNSSSTSPPPFMVGAVELEIDKETGESHVRRYCSAVDCGTPLNPNLAKVQAEGGILQGIGMALTESITYNDRGKPIENSLMQYRIPTRQDIGHIEVELVSSYEERGPFGAKSIGEVVINTPGPAIQEAVYQATGKRFYELPITPEQICMALKEKERSAET
jgi:CO/xanthine dehydrogenase Mo-binding subunit